MQSEDDDEAALLALIRQTRGITDSPDRSDAQVVRARAAVEQLLMQNIGWLERMCVCEMRSESSGQDCLQVVLFEIARALAQFEGRSALRTWMFAIARRVIHRARTRELQHGSRFVGGLPGVEERTPAAVDGPDRVLELADDQRRLAVHVRELPEKQRQAVILHFFEDLSVEETARRMNCSAGSVKTHLSRARRKLRVLLDQSGRAESPTVDAGGRL